MLNVSGYVEESIVDGPGLRFVLFLQGCPHHCKGCHNEHTWSFDINKQMTCEEVYELIETNHITKGVTISGGEPMCQSEELIPLVKMCKMQGYDVIVYTGYKYEDIAGNALLNFVDYVVDGKFELEKKSLNCLYRGSTNQRIIDVKASRLTNVVIEVNYETFGG